MSTPASLPVAPTPALLLRHSHRRYLQFSLLLLAAGAIYPLLYLRQNFESSVLAAFQIDADQLGRCYTLLGIVYALAYLPSGWLADRFSPRCLVAFSLAAVGLLGLWFSTYPGLVALQCIFIGWGVAAGLTFWASLIKGVQLLAGQHEQGRFFGLLDGGRGLVEATLATAAVALFAAADHQGALPQETLRPVILLYSGTCLVIALLVLLTLGSPRTAPPDGAALADDEAPEAGRVAPALLPSLLQLARLPRLWMLALVILCGYQLFWATYSFSAYLQEGHGLSAVAAGAVTVAKLWMRPVGGISAGFLGDRFGNGRILFAAMVLASAGLILLAAFPGGTGIWLLLPVVIAIGVMTYAVRGLYWAIFGQCEVPPTATGLAIGIISVIAYSPDIFLPMINSAITHHFPGASGYRVYFAYIAGCGLLGALVASRFMHTTQTDKVSQ